MRVLRKIMALTLALTLVLSMGAMTAFAENPDGHRWSSIVNGRNGTAVAGIAFMFTGEQDDMQSSEITEVQLFRDTVLLPDVTIGNTGTLEKKSESGDDGVETHFFIDFNKHVEGNGEYYATFVFEEKTYRTVPFTIDGTGEGGDTTPAPELENLFYWIDMDLPTAAEDGPRIPLTRGKYNYTVSLPVGLSFSTIELLDYKGDGERLGYGRGDYEVATSQNPVATLTIVSAKDESLSTTYKVTFVKGGGSNRPSGGGNDSTPPPSENTANNPETTDKVNDTVAALADPTKELPKDAVKTTTAGGAGITTIPLKLSTGNATLGSGIFNTIGGAPATVGLKLTVSNGMSGGSAEIIIPGGFGKITEPGRFSYTMDYKNIAENNSTMLAAVKGDNAVSMTAKVGGNFTLPVTATVTVPTKLVNGSSVNIYKYDPITNKLIVIGKATVKDGKITFATKMMGELLFTTGTV